MLRFGKNSSLMVICTALAGCAPHNARPYDHALSSTAEVAAFEFTNPNYALHKNGSEAFQLQRRASFNSKVKGIYIAQSTLENREYLQYLIDQSQQTGINTFVVDLNVVTNTYERNILLIKNSGIRYVARIRLLAAEVNEEQLKSEAYWLSRFRMVEAALNLGAEEIQLDYDHHGNINNLAALNSIEVQKMLSWFKNKIGNQAKLQADVHGIHEFNTIPSKHHGNSNTAFNIDACCPVLYPTRFEPYREHAKRPFELVYTALTKFKNTFDGATPFEIYPYIEVSNYRHKFSEQQLQGYIHSQIAAVEAAKADGWYAWNANNKYDNLFAILKEG
jgi:hypothetical protein